MDEENSKPQEQRSTTETTGSHPEVPITNPAESKKNCAKGAEQGYAPNPLYHVPRWRRFARWLCEMDVAEVGMLLLTASIGYSTWRYTTYAERQWRVMKGQLTQMQTANVETQQGIKIATRSAKAAEESNQNAVDFFSQDQRPYVGLYLSLEPPPGETQNAMNTGSVLDWWSDPIKPTQGRYFWSFHFKNFGKTPALDVRTNKVLELGPDAFKHWHWTATDQQHGGSILPPGDNYYVTAGSKIVSKQNADAYLKGNRNIIVFGHVDYMGLDGRSYWTEFCFDKLASGAVQVCPSHNLMK